MKSEKTDQKVYLEFLFMIQKTIVTYTYPKCGGENIVRNGHDCKGDQKYYCEVCENCGTLPVHRGYNDYANPDETNRAGTNQFVGH
jgi:predicted RNA-binding Zn-ribbon protein involved in translation (DUF1610 family)